MAKSTAILIVEQPHRPDLLRQCPRCLAVFALQLVRTEAHPKWGDVRVYHCQKCDAQTEYLANLPPYVV